jgi:hypothetical protein
MASGRNFNCTGPVRPAKAGQILPGATPRGPAGPPTGGGRVPEGGLHLRRRCGVLIALAAGSAGTGHDGPCRRPASMRTVFPFLDRGRTFPEPQGTREFGSAKRATVMHVHHGLGSNVTSARRSLLTWVLPGLKARWIRNADSGRGRRFVSAAGSANDSHRTRTRPGAGRRYLL